MNKVAKRESFGELFAGVIFALLALRFPAVGVSIAQPAEVSVNTYFDSPDAAAGSAASITRGRMSCRAAS